MERHSILLNLVEILQTVEETAYLSLFVFVMRFNWAQLAEIEVYLLKLLILKIQTNLMTLF